MGGELTSALPPQQRLRAGAGHMGQKHLALRRTVDGQAGAGVRHHPQAAPRLHLIQRDDTAALADGEHNGRAGLSAQMLHVGPRHRGDIPGALHLPPVLEQPQPQRIAPVGRLRHHVVCAHGGQQAEHRAFGIAAQGGQLLEQQRLPRLTQNLQQLHGLRHGQNDVPIHHRASAPFPTSIPKS